MSTALAVIRKKEDLLKVDKPALVDEIIGLRNSVVNLGDGQVFVKRNSNGIVRACTQTVYLREELGEIQKIQKKTMVTAAGANRLNQTPGLSILTPPTVVVDGHNMSNPYIEKDNRTKVIQSVYVRKVVFGPSPIGNMVAIDNTLFFNIFTYFLQDLQAKIKKYPVTGYYGINKGSAPLEKYTYPEKKWDNPAKKFKETGVKKEVVTKDGTWIFFELEKLGSTPVGIWVDTSHREIQSCLDSHVQRQKFGDRHAQAICVRNALLKHPAIATQTVKVENGVAKVKVFGFRHDLDFEAVNKMATDISEGKVDSSNVTVNIQSEEASYDEATTTAKDEGDEFGQSPTNDQDDIPDPPLPKETPKDAISDRDKILALIGEQVAQIEAKKFTSIKNKLIKKFGKSYSDFSDKQLEELLQTLSETE